MDSPALFAVLANVCALLVHAGLGFYWAGRITGRLALIEHRQNEHQRVLEAHIRECREGFRRGP